jgi:hypothetical protein
LFAQAADAGIEALAIVDRNSLAGIVRAHEAAKTIGVRLIVGYRVDLADGMSILAYPADRPAYGRSLRLPPFLLRVELGKNAEICRHPPGAHAEKIRSKCQVSTAKAIASCIAHCARLAGGAAPIKMRCGRWATDCRVYDLGQCSGADILRTAFSICAARHGWQIRLRHVRSR